MATLLKMFDGDFDFMKSEHVAGPEHKPQTLAEVDVPQ